MKNPIIPLFIFFTFFVINHSAAQDSINWLYGTWQGVGYQAPTDTTWDIILNYDDKPEELKINYPTLNCSGRWKLINQKCGYAEFVEVITEGTQNCDNGVKVVVTQIDERFISVAYFLPEYITGVVASSVLEKSTIKPVSRKIKKI